MYQKAILKKMIVSSPAGGCKNGQSGGLKIFVFLNKFFYQLNRNAVENIENKRRKSLGNMKQTKLPC